MMYGTNMAGAYGIFLAEKCISTMAGDAWKKLSEEEKKPYQEKYEQAPIQPGLLCSLQLLRPQAAPKHIQRSAANRALGKA